VARGPRSLLVVTAAVRRAREAIQVVMVTAARGHRCVSALRVFRSLGVGRFGRGGRQWERKSLR